ncbi:hypothetical protein ACFOPQ_00265 [Deinococcus antarcticus]|uniref:Uncharacterized protein n=1 Tax=Deinococcus antarcticus TaxID=1298767 RepID=A0ABV8A1A6_9DEIO
MAQITSVLALLPALNLTGMLNTQQGEVNLVVPASVAVQFDLQKWKMRSLTFNGEKVGDSIEASGSHAMPDFNAARYKVRFTVLSQQTDISVIQK